ncbi:prenyltransferase [Nocardia sp. NPDC004654]|uniref:prenyltransferase n=1 Tax=Nocardia sp. NPDC004654 TaxID=3154776 RepID=UPI0033BDA734
MRRFDPPSVPAVLTERQCRATARSIADAQESSGAIPWFRGGHTDPWDHVESAMALTTAGLLDEARAAYTWSALGQRPDGSWPIRIQEGVVEDENIDTNFCAYIATGVWHYTLRTEDEQFARALWPTVRRAIDLVLTEQGTQGEIRWARSPAGSLPDSLRTGCSSIYHSIRCALALADYLGKPQPDWEMAAGRLRHALQAHPDAFLSKDRYSMDWYYPILCGVQRGQAAAGHLRRHWNTFVVPELGIRCVSDRPWVTGAETCELVMALDTIGARTAALRQFTAMQHLRDADGSYWTGLVFTDGLRWPEERTTWTSAAVVLAADALTRTTRASGIFRGDGLPQVLDFPGMCSCGTAYPRR